MQIGPTLNSYQETANHMVRSLQFSNHGFQALKSQIWLLHSVLSPGAHVLLSSPTYFLEGYSDFSGTYNVACFDTYNASNPLYSDLSVGNAYDRQWDWFICGGFGWYVCPFCPLNPLFIKN